MSGQPPDYANAAKEAVSSVEAVAQIIVRNPSATLGDAVKHLRTSGRLEPPLLEGLEELWGFTSESPGVRHGSPSPTTIDVARAQYVLDSSAAAIRLLLSLDEAAR